MTSPLDVHHDLAAVCGPVTLRVAGAADLLTLAAHVTDGLFEPGEASTLGAWYDPDDLAASARRTVAYHMAAYADIDAAHLQLPLGIYVDGTIIGVQSIHADHFAVRREASTGSWIARRWRGRGYGHAARHAILAVAFDAMGADWATTSALDTNPASIRVTERCGYAPDGTDVDDNGHGGRLILRRYRLDRDTWATNPRPAVHLDGFEEWLTRAGLASPTRS